MTRTTNEEILSNNARYACANTTGAKVLVSITFGVSRYSIHPSAWKGNSPNFAPRGL